MVQDLLDYRGLLICHILGFSRIEFPYLSLEVWRTVLSYLSLELCCIVALSFCGEKHFFRKNRFTLFLYNMALRVMDREESEKNMQQVFW
jgi:hypothetical protein